MESTRKNKEWRQAVSRLAVAQYRMKRFQCRDEAKPEEEKTNEENEADRSLVVANVHLHHSLANNNTQLNTTKEPHLRKFYDNLAEAIIAYKVRLVNGDFNMDAIRAVTELRARGFCVIVVSWFPWKKTGGDFPYQDQQILGPPQI